MGPGDPDLLTVKAQRILMRAPVLVHFCKRGKRGNARTIADAILRDPAIDAVCIGTWPYRHREYVVRALEAGKHVLTEARMAMNAIVRDWSALFVMWSSLPSTRSSQFHSRCEIFASRLMN